MSEDTEFGGSVPDQVEATDGDQDPLVYSLSGTDAASFSINKTDGQITTNVPLDFETKKSYRVTVRALNPSGASGDSHGDNQRNER